MEGGPPIFNPGFPSPNLIYGLTRAPLQGFHLLRRVIQTLRRSSGLSAFDRLYSRNRCCFLFLCLLRWFTSARSLFMPIHSAQSTPKGGLPHSDTPRSQPSYRLPWTFRRFLRPSSPLDTKSSAMYPCAWSYQPDAVLLTLACAQVRPTRSARKPRRLIIVVKTSTHTFACAPAQTEARPASIDRFINLRHYKSSF